MALINLLDWREELRAERKQNFVIGLVVSASIAAVMVFTYGQKISADTKYQEGRNQHITQEISALNARVQEIKELNQKRAELLDRMEVIQGLQGNRPVIVRIFDELVRSLPDGVFYTTIERKGDRVTLEGRAESNSRVSSLMRNLDESDWFAEPNLKNVVAADDERGGNDFVLTVKQVLPDRNAGEKNAAGGES